MIGYGAFEIYDCRKAYGRLLGKCKHREEVEKMIKGLRLDSTIQESETHVVLLIANNIYEAFNEAPLI